MEFSQKITIFLIGFGVCGVIAHFTLLFLGKQSSDLVVVTMITEVVMTCYGYLMYQYGLKESRNKYKLNKDGMPFDGCV